MRIAFLVDSCIGCLPTFILNQIEGLINLGVDVHIFCECSPREEKMERRSWNLGSRAHYFMKIPQNKFKRILKAILLLTEVLHRDPITILQAINFFRYGKDSLTLKNLFYTIPFLGKKYDILHCHYGPVGKEFLFLKSILKIDYITSFYGFDVSKYVVRHSDKVYGDLFKKSDLFIVLSDVMKNELIKLGADSCKVMKHRVGVNLEELEFKKRELNAGEKLTILTIAKLIEKKGLEYSIRSVTQIIDKFPNLEYLIAGEGPLRSKLESLINQLHCEDKIKLLGWKDRYEIKKLLAKAHILILTSVTGKDEDREGTPVALMEAQASGIPVISTYHSGIPEIVADGKSGFLIPERDVEALSERLTYLIEHPELWPKMGKTGRKIVEKEFDIKKLSKKLLKIYNELCREQL